MIKIGNEVKCIITGFKGFVTGKTEYINGCVQFLVKPKTKKNEEDKYPVGSWLDQEQLKVIGEGISLKAREVGGERNDSPSDR